MHRDILGSSRISRNRRGGGRNGVRRARNAYANRIQLPEP